MEFWCRWAFTKILLQRDLSSWYLAALMVTAVKADATAKRTVCPVQIFAVVVTSVKILITSSSFSFQWWWQWRAWRTRNVYRGDTWRTWRIHTANWRIWKHQIWIQPTKQKIIRWYFQVLIIILKKSLKFIQFG